MQICAVIYENATATKYAKIDNYEMFREMRGL
jgi:hypothetical protein